MKKLFKKLRRQAGLSMAETLAAVAALTLLCLALNSGLNLTVRAYRTLTAEAETQLLLSTAADAIIDELRFAKLSYTLRDGNMLDVYESQRYGLYARLVIDDDSRLVVKNTTSAEGHPLLASGVYGRPSASEQASAAEREKSRPYKLSWGDSGGIAYDKDTHVFTFTLRAEQPGLASAEGTFSVRCLNGGTSP